MPHISSLAYRSFALLNGETSPNPYVSASLSVGGGNDDARSFPQFTLCDAVRQTADGRLTWDADHLRNGSASPFFSVAPVRLDVKSSGECLLAVGTGDFVKLVTRPYRWIEKVQIAALAGTGAPGRIIQWDSIELAFTYADGRSDTCRSSCLPGVVTGRCVRRAAQASEAPRDQLPRQFAEISTGCRDVVGIKLRGQVTLRANDGAAGGTPLQPQDLQGQVLVFTDASSR
jgi:hypothetical protein